MGQAVIDALETTSNLIVEAPTGTGKSLAALVPIIDKISSTKTKRVRAVISTATKNLQDQYMSDLEWLRPLYGHNFSFASLKGRNNYLCFEELKRNAGNNTELLSAQRKLETHKAALGSGERSDVERVLGYELTEFQWRAMGGSVRRCAERKCAVDQCYSTKAREIAAKADIVITNNAVVKVDAETRVDDMSMPFLGDVDVLVIDEAHELEQSLISGWTEEFNLWELSELSNKIIVGISQALKYAKSGPNLERRVSESGENLERFLDSVVRFFSELHEEQPWDFVTDTLCPKDVYVGSRPSLIDAMHVFEEEGPEILAESIDIITEAYEFFGAALKNMRDSGVRGTRKISVGRTSAGTLKSVLEKILLSMGTKNGTIVSYGVPYTVLVDGFTTRSGNLTAKISVIPMDISKQAQDIWKDRTCILMSATLRDLTDNSFRYLKSSLGFEAQNELFLTTVFDLKNKQITYVTPGRAGGYGDIVEIPGARYNYQEMIDLINAANGRTLVLFTARRELDDAAEYLKTYGGIAHKILVQTSDANKARLSEEFKKDEHSILLATKSFFQGFDAPGGTLSLVILAKYPLPQYNALCKNQIAWWRTKGFPNWYESRSMEVFQQAAGRVIRTEEDSGVVALIDQRCVDASSTVFKTAHKAVESLGSPVVRSIDDVSRFLG